MSICKGKSFSDSLTKKKIVKIDNDAAFAENDINFQIMGRFCKMLCVSTKINV